MVNVPGFQGGFVFHLELKTTDPKTGKRERERLNGGRRSGSTGMISLLA